MSDTRQLPDWADDLRRRYLRGEASMFLLRGNVFDTVLCDNRAWSLVDFLNEVLRIESRESRAL